MGSSDSGDPHSIRSCSRLLQPLVLIMKSFVSVLGLIGAAAAAPQYLADTPEVQQAKIDFAAAFNKAARGATIALEQAGTVVDPNNPDFSPAAEPYVHVDIPAEPYVHIEPEYVHQEGEAAVAAPAPAAPAAPVAPVAPVQFQPAPVSAPQQQVVNPFINVPTQNAALAFNPALAQQYAGIYNPQQQQQFAFNPYFAAGFPQAALPAPAVVQGGCYNNKGEGVECFVPAN